MKVTLTKDPTSWIIAYSPNGVTLPLSEDWENCCEYSIEEYTAVEGIVGIKNLYGLGRVITEPYVVVVCSTREHKLWNMVIMWSLTCRIADTSKEPSSTTWVN